MSKNYLPLCYEEIEGLNFNPSCLEIPHYALPDTFGDTGAEDFMARVISFSIKEGEWVGVGLDYFFGQMTETFISLIHQKHRKDRNEEMKNDYERRNNSRWFKFLSWFGYKLPKPNYFDESSITTVLYNRNDFKKAFHYLVDHGYLSVDKLDDDIYLCPTEDAIRKLKKFYAPPIIRVFSRLQMFKIEKCINKKEIANFIEENTKS
ncbi:hypothetical protein II582_00005 [bacterium]|nr:hypothetical protein [bacterium]